MDWSHEVDLAYSRYKQLLEAIDPEQPINLHVTPTFRAFSIAGTAPMLKPFLELPPRVGKIPIVFTLYTGDEKKMYRWDIPGESAQLAKIVRDF